MPAPEAEPDDFRQLELLFSDPIQRDYEVIRSAASRRRTRARNSSRCRSSVSSGSSPSSAVGVSAPAVPHTPGMAGSHSGRARRRGRRRACLTNWSPNTGSDAARD